MLECWSAGLLLHVGCCLLDTSLLDPTVAPTSELIPLYAQRWEEELYFRQLKLQLRRTDLLQSHTVTTAAQEIALLILSWPPPWSPRSACMRRRASLPSCRLAS